MAPAQFSLVSRAGAFKDLPSGCRRYFVREEWRNLDREYVRCEDDHVSMLKWMVDMIGKSWLRELSERIAINQWDADLGLVRDQMEHIICWVYVSSDLVSSALRRCNRTPDFVPLCPHFIFWHAREQNVGMDPRAPPDHKCFGDSMPCAMLLIKDKGAPTQLNMVFDCSTKPEVDASALIHRISGWEEISTLQEALKRLATEPVGANLLMCECMWAYVGTNRVYRGGFYPDENSRFVGYHSVIISGLGFLEGECVARCKLSNGLQHGDGYLYVSLSVVVTILSHTGEIGVKVSEEPQHLLFDFIVPLL